MDATWGADPEALDQLAAQLGNWATSLAQQKALLEAHLHSAPWHGQDADEFRLAWHNRLSPTIAVAVGALHNAQTSLRQNAAQQREASGVSGGVATVAHSATGMLRSTYVAGAGPTNAVTLRRHLKHLTEVSVSRDSHHQLFDASLSRSGQSSLHGIPVQGRLQAGIHADQSGHASLTLSREGLAAEGSLGIGAMATALASGSLGGKYLNVQGRGEVAAGVRADAEGRVDIGRDGIDAKVGGQAFAGAEASGSITENVGGVGVTEGVHGYAGFGVSGNADAQVTMDDVKVSAHIGAALGIGAGVDIKIEIHPDRVIAGVSHFFHI